ncbi:MAG: hypothetical protein CMH90_05615 [Oceanicaulis sp.]|uniref:hypothetical protein n=1 Tax=Oceanicaulis sp. UBA2681 TaxID=1947007 RepID=UPI000C0AFDF9|nr:hypothetical protein [Oceanicaulis sp. UBA2681]MAP48941.1 hypothetical protein [Oceanicaulis sp.]HCR65532.1 hypothetical protein [Oceanicaulis sp.]|tara:strand:+ start:3034 stop:3261 length:228 start_codon:yes stop_codon:yes gene_type:complete
MDDEPKKKPFIQFRPVSAAIVAILAAIACFILIDNVGLSILIVAVSAGIALFDLGGGLDGPQSSLFDNFGGDGGD